MRTNIVFKFFGKFQLLEPSKQANKQKLFLRKVSQIAEKKLVVQSMDSYFTPWKIIGESLVV